MTFTQKLNHAWHSTGSLLTVGLDPDPNFFPAELHAKPLAVFEFCRQIVDATAPYVCSFKPQIAYFSMQGAETQLEMLSAYIRVSYPHLFIVLDAKRGDIGSTAQQYASEAFERYQADAVTVNPYLGFDSIEPYLRWEDRGVFILCRTSNPGGSELQFLKTEKGIPLYLHLADLVANKWNSHKRCGLVVGATFPDEIALVRQCVGADMPLLVPGIGTQGGDIQRTVQNGINALGNGMLINASRAVLYASKEENWREAAAHMAKTLRDQINAARFKEASLDLKN